MRAFYILLFICLIGIFTSALCFADAKPLEIIMKNGESFKGVFYDLGDKYCAPAVGGREMCFNVKEIREVKETVIRIQSLENSLKHVTRRELIDNCSNFSLSTYKGRVDFLSCTTYMHYQRQKQ